jgi:predicted RND superfamily exporter protein
MRLCGQKLNMMNLAAVPLLVGICVDYGIFLVSLARDARRDGDAAREKLTASLAAGCYAVVMCAATTVLGFGSLITTSVPAMRALGFVVGVGVTGCLFATLFTLAPLLLRTVGPRPVGLHEAGLAPATP